ncbi:hypothetical protein AAG593_10410 [Citromicrobium bathyomarinum]|uniref:hypothetical protein n=1 Tax=Sphingomonadales TaxID=204457 RepID=UPI0001DD112B|nr:MULTISPECIES: hypothetical protein [Sphingomonadales]MAO04889.1 hypothetical protein [Citromicrobium sp.]ALG60735.1 hypothetical protein WG74_07785 [Citromicrobium sp. JL477]KPM14675.1 hypothetical protein VO58_10960 [Citromicrobium sp. JL1351]KPM15758.1 hypothetical protein WG75_06730 [Citromicrobium sp. WPS32]KPM19975.1 hypothetical protein VM77_05975 [Citromicrobium sp. JL31]|tara:strand:- start:564 stop:1022 length:459 start_codon:yes stop_codon:yes gene_type:complete
MDKHLKARTPWHLWVVGIVSLAWNAFGANDYLQTQLGNLAYFESMMDGIEATPQQALAYFQSYPAWVHGAWAVGVWGAVLGSLLLLLRTRFAVHAFALSLLGLATTTVYQMVVGQPDWVQNTTTTIITIVIWSIATFLLIYAASMRSKGVLR